MRKLPLLLLPVAVVIAAAPFTPSPDRSPNGSLRAAPGMSVGAPGSPVTPTDQGDTTAENAPSQTP